MSSGESRVKSRWVKTSDRGPVWLRTGVQREGPRPREAVSRDNSAGRRSEHWEISGLETYSSQAFVRSLA